MKRFRKTMVSGLLLSSLVFSYTLFPNAATEHFNDATTQSNWSQWENKWKTTSVDYEKVSLTPGKNESELSFAWYSKSDKNATPIVKLSTNKNMSDAKTFKGTATPAIESYNTNKVTAVALKENTTYYYTYSKNGVESDVQEYKTKSFSDYEILFAGDPQIGASK